MASASVLLEAEFSLGTNFFVPGVAKVIVSNSNTTAFVIADAVQFCDTSSAVTDANPDGDDLSNYQEYLAGTDPLNAASRFNMRALLDAAPRQMRLFWPSTTNRTYRIEVSEDLKTFQAYRQHIPATPPQNSESVSSVGDKQYFRIVLE